MKTILPKDFMAWDNGGPWGKAKPSAKPTSKAGGQKPVGQNPVGSGTSHGPRGPQPELEDVVNQMAERLRGYWRQGNMGSGGNAGGRGNAEGPSLPPILLQWRWILLALAGLWLASGLYINGPGTQGVVTTFGAFSHTSEEGLRYRLPWPLQAVQQVNVSQVRQVTIGDLTNTDSLLPVGAEMLASSRQDQGLMLTGDGNIVDLAFTVQWRIADPMKYLFNVADVENTVVEVGESAMREVVGGYRFDEAIQGERRALISSYVKQHLQALLDYYNAGVQITSVNLQQVLPPSAVLDAARDVQTAEADRERMINEAQAYANQIVPVARGAAAQLVQQAEGYRTAVVAEAEGDAARFNAQVGAYQANPGVVRDRLYYATMERVMAPLPKVVSTNKNGGNVLPFLPLQNLLPVNQPAAPQPATGAR